MSEITLKAIEDILDEKLAALNTKVDRTAIVLAGVVETQKDIANTLGRIQDTLDAHTTSLDAIAKQLVDITTDRAALLARLARYDRFMGIVAKRLDLDLHKLLDDAR